jgi:hypothetical protein
MRPRAVPLGLRGTVASAKSTEKKKGRPSGHPLSFPHTAIHVRTTPSRRERRQTDIQDRKEPALFVGPRLRQQASEKIEIDHNGPPKRRTNQADVTAPLMWQPARAGVQDRGGARLAQSQLARLIPEPAIPLTAVAGAKPEICYGDALRCYCFLLR